MRRTGFVAGLAMAVLATGCTSKDPQANRPTTVAGASGNASARAPVSTAEAQTQLRIVEASKVCMVNDQHMGTEQIRVDVDGKTYFGCCEMCRDRLNQDGASRVAMDPVSGKQVDKASAVIGALPSGAVRYFESLETAQRFVVP